MAPQSSPSNFVRNPGQLICETAEVDLLFKQLQNDKRAAPGGAVPPFGPRHRARRAAGVQADSVPEVHLGSDLRADS